MQTLKIMQSMDRDDDTIRILACEGYMNFETYDYAMDIVNRLIQHGINRIVFDLSEVEYISSSGWAVFLGPSNTARSFGGDVKIAAMKDQVKFVFEALELNNVIESYDTVEKAVAAFKKKGN
ncbi:MAG TPA: anti-sigma factor antagonist [bacterium]|nr:anti-sigma factor antagonist [bacterium]